MSDITNSDRGLWAEGALGEFVEQSGLDQIDACTVCDLIADLGHYCDGNGIDFIAAVRRGIGHWRAETVDTKDCNRIDILPDVAVAIFEAAP